MEPSGCYDNVVTVRSFRPHYHLAGGVNLPKIIDCLGSDGKSRRQLVKVRSMFWKTPWKFSHGCNWSQLIVIVSDRCDPVSLLQSHQLSVVVLYTWVLGFKNKWWLWSWAVSESDEKIDQRRWKPANISSYHWQSLILSLFPDKYKDCLLPNITIIKTFLSGVCVCLHRNTSELMIYLFKAFSLWPTGFFPCTFTFYISYKIKNRD